MQGIAWVFRKQHAPTPTTQPPGAYVRNKTQSFNSPAYTFAQVTGNPSPLGPMKM